MTKGMALLVLCASTWVQAAPDGAALFNQHCAACHQEQGQGTVGLAPALQGAHWQALGRDRDYLPHVLVHGLSGSIVVNGERHAGSMPAFGAQLDDASLAAVAQHLVTSIQKRTDAPPYEAADLARAREAGGSPPQTRQRRARALP